MRTPAYQDQLNATTEAEVEYLKKVQDSGWKRMDANDWTGNHVLTTAMMLVIPKALMATQQAPSNLLKLKRSSWLVLVTYSTPKQMPKHQPN